MKVTNLKITNLRAIEAAELDFQPGFNLIIGVNGVGKTTVLDALRICLSEIVRYSNKLKHSESFSKDDIRIEGGALSVSCKYELAGLQYEYLIHSPRESSVPQRKKTGMPRDSAYDTPIKKEFVGKSPPIWAGTTIGRRPFAVLFSTKRAVPTERGPTKGSAAGGISAAFAEALSSRELRLKEFADWMRAQVALRTERSEATRVLDAFERAVRRFLPGFSHLRVEGDDSRLTIDRGKTPLEVRLLSDGERGVLALVLDLTRRLAQANPEMHDPAGSAEAIVLIDEIDLHLHPKWQRDIVRNLTAAFPKCQFIATTHSPQVIGEVEHGRIQIIKDGQVYSPTHSYGVDSSRVLEEIMDSWPRTKAVDELLANLSRLIGDSKLSEARISLAKLVENVGENDPEVTRLRTLIDFVEGNE